MATRDYPKGDLTVHWDSSRCIHSGRCLKGRPEVFDVNARPWVDVDGASAEEIVSTVRRCPSGALTYSWADGAGEPERYDEVEALAHPDGPVYVRGPVALFDEDGSPLEVGLRVALCGCGLSSKAPLCDGSHRRRRNADRTNSA